MSRVLVTGGNGFIGKALVKQLVANGFSAFGTVRTVVSDSNMIVGPALDASADWTKLLAGIDVIIHTAGIAHIQKANLPEADYFEVNVRGTVQLVRQAIDAGIKRFIFLSSAKVFGEVSEGNSAFNINSPLHASDPYSESKIKCEAELRKITESSSMELVIIRPPLVYGPGVKANFAQLIKLVSLGIPLPFGAINNKRSMVGINNLIDLIITTVHHPNAAGKIFLVSDDEDLSTTQLLHKIKTLLNVQTWLIPVNYLFLQSMGKILGLNKFATRLFGSFTVDISDTKRVLNWKPPFTMDTELARTIMDME